MNPSQSMMQTNWSNHQFPPTPPPSIPPTLPYLPPSKPLHLAHRRCHVHQHKCALQAHLLSLRPSHALHETPPSTSPRGLGHHDATRTYGFDLNPHWQEDRDHYDNQKIETFPRTIRQSAFTQKLDIEGCDPFGSTVGGLDVSTGQQLLASKTCPWTRSLPDPYGESATVVFMTELLTQLRSRGSTWTVSHIAKPGRMGNCWTKPTTPNMLLNKSQTSSTVGCQLAQLIQTPNMRSTSSGINWQNYANEQVKTLVTTLHHPGRVHRHPALRIHLSNGPSWTTQRAQHLHQHRHLILPACWSALPRSIHGWLNTCQPPWLCELSPNGSKNFHCLSQRGRFSLKTLPRPKKLGGHISLRKPLKLSNEWLSWWAYRLASWAKIMMCWTSCVLWQRLSVLPIFD